MNRQTRAGYSNKIVRITGPSVTITTNNKLDSTSRNTSSLYILIFPLITNIKSHTKRCIETIFEMPVTKKKKKAGAVKKKGKKRAKKNSSPKKTSADIEDQHVVKSHLRLPGERVGVYVFFFRCTII
jgi:hypothetical protein